MTGCVKTTVMDEKMKLELNPYEQGYLAQIVDSRIKGLQEIIHLDEDISENELKQIISDCQMLITVFSRLMGNGNESS